MGAKVCRYTLNCDNCGEAYYSPDAFPDPQYCDTCLMAYKVGIKKLKEWLELWKLKIH